MIRIVVAYIATLAVFAAVDFVWLTQVGPGLYNPLIGSILAMRPRLEPAVIFYLLYIGGLLYFAVLPGLNGAGWRGALTKGAIFGFMAYATYDLTNHATLVVWSTKITILDMLWGTFLSGTASIGGYAITRKLVKA
ncbi:hypothetical protein ASE00_05270 [Sphingomonas sp. Root710]|uniref:DUF2177 family protein n=1 Tax=Sphingomonas sp. Root710 TaxID=1736594 RepID=UPI0006F1EEDF|nr:DUF2177 family protein [Sphingomonas sp. Root710]KRB86147.1 hypothetical protein ASE00_05270 [Sphingomonas sp. Root710]